MKFPSGSTQCNTVFLRIKGCARASRSTSPRTQLASVWLISPQRRKIRFEFVHHLWQSLGNGDQFVSDDRTRRRSCLLRGQHKHGLLWVSCPPFSHEVLSDQLLHRIPSFSICQRLSSTCLQDLVRLLLSQIASVLVLHCPVATTSSSLCDECSCQLLFAMQLPSRLKSLCAMKVVASSKQALQTQYWASSLRECVVPAFPHYWVQSRFELWTVSEQMSTSPRDHSRRASTRYCLSILIAVHVHFQMSFAWILRGTLQCFSRHSFQIPRNFFNCVMCPALGFDIARARHVIASKMSTKCCAKYAHRVGPLRNVVACFPSRIGLFSIVSASLALFFILGVLTMLLCVSPRSFDNWRTCFWSAPIAINSLLITLTVLCKTSISLSKYSAAPIMSKHFVSNFSCNSFQEISNWCSAAAVTKSSPWQNPFTTSGHESKTMQFWAWFHVNNTFTQTP